MTQEPAHAPSESSQCAAGAGSNLFPPNRPASTNSNPLPSTSGTSPTTQAAETSAPVPTHRAQGQGRFSQYHASQQSPAWSGTDWLTEDKAMRLVAKISAYWAKRGHDVKIWAEPFKAPESITRGGWFAIRSDMVAGWPRPSHPMVRP